MPRRCPVSISHNDPRFVGWRKSTRSDGGSNCVQVGRCVDGSGVVGVVDSKAGPSGSVLVFEPSSWRAFVGAMRHHRLG
jgi:hypothetical protein